MCMTPSLRRLPISLRHPFNRQILTALLSCNKARPCTTDRAVGPKSYDVCSITLISVVVLASSISSVLAQTVSQSCVEWAVPGLREGLVNELLRTLPKSIRRQLMPFPPKVAEIVNELKPDGEVGLLPAMTATRRSGIAPWW